MKITLKIQSENTKGLNSGRGIAWGLRCVSNSVSPVMESPQVWGFFAGNYHYYSSLQSYFKA